MLSNKVIRFVVTCEPKKATSGPNNQFGENRNGLIKAHQAQEIVLGNI